MMRLDQDRQRRFEQPRIKYALSELEKLGILPEKVTTRAIEFIWQGEMVRVFPYSGWFSGKSVTDGRGLEKLLSQLRKRIK